MFFLTPFNNYEQICERSDQSDDDGENAVKCFFINDTWAQTHA